MSRRANFPTANDIQNQIESSFENAGKDVEEISVESQSKATNEVEKLVKDFNTPRAEWDFTIKAIERTMGLINGGLFDYLNDQIIKNSFSRICLPLLEASNNLRSSLVKQSCLLIAQIAHELGPKNKFDLFMPIGDDIIASLSSQTSHGTQIIAESCRFAIIHIARSCANKKILRSILELSKVKSSANRLISADCLCFICGGEINENTQNPWNDTRLVEQNDNAIIEALQRLMEDASQNIRKTSRLAAQIFIENYPKFKEQFLSGADERSIEYIDRKSEMKKKGTLRRRSKSPYASALPVPKNKKKRSSVPTKNIDQEDSQNSEEQNIANEEDNFSSEDTQKSKPKLQDTDTQTNDYNDMANKSINTSSKRRSRSSLPSKLTSFESKQVLAYEEGHEKEYLEEIEEYINTNQQFELSAFINSIIPNLIQFCQSEDKQISQRSLSIIQNLIHTYPNNFTKYIPNILNVVLSPNANSENNDQLYFDNSEYQNDEEENMSICRDMQAIYDPNLLLESIEGICLTPLCLIFVANLCDDIEINLHKNEVCENVYGIAMQFINEDQDNVRRIIYAIWWQNSDFFVQKSIENQHSETDDNQDVQQLSGLDPKLREMIQNFKENPGHPRFNPRGVSLWCEEVRKFIQTEKFTSEFNENKDSDDIIGLFNEISHALILTNVKNLVIILMIDVLNTLDNAHYNIFLFDIVRYYSDRKAKDILKLLKYMISNIDNSEIIDALLDEKNPAFQLRNENHKNLMIKNMAEIITEITKNGDKEKVKESFDQIVAFLLDFIDSKCTEVRRAVILTFVELSFVIKEETNQVINEKLTKVQQKLVNFYRDQREKSF